MKFFTGLNVNTLCFGVSVTKEDKVGVSLRFLHPIKAHDWLNLTDWSVLLEDYFRRENIFLYIFTYIWCSVMYLWLSTIICRITYRLSAYISCGEGIFHLIVWLKDNRALRHRGISCSTSGLVIQTVFICRINFFLSILVFLWDFWSNEKYRILLLCAISLYYLRYFHFTNQRCALLGHSLLQHIQMARCLSLIKITHQYQNIEASGTKGSN